MVTLCDIPILIGLSFDKAYFRPPFFPGKSGKTIINSFQSHPCYLLSCGLNHLLDDQSSISHGPFFPAVSEKMQGPGGVVAFHHEQAHARLHYHGIRSPFSILYHGTFMCPLPGASELLDRRHPNFRDFRSKAVL